MNRSIKKQFVLSASIFAAGLFSLVSWADNAQAGAKGVIELFTSQGCSSCPPADELAAEYAKDPDLVVLTLPVTYWDYLGWKDTFAKKEFTHRQYGYAALRGDQSVYTPQVVVNGSNHAVGSDPNGINKLVKRGSLPVDINIEQAGVDIKIDVEGKSPISTGTVWMALLQRSGTVAIGRGENRNTEITYTNIVKEMRPLGEWKGEAMTMKFAKPDLMTGDINGLAIILQTKQGKISSKILGAATWMNESS
ncbi:MAG: DUF1223 domain-containing protein [Hyphomicrobiales bacterium]